MRGDFETLLYDAGVDIVLNGHVHAYERTLPVYGFKANACGMIHLNLGDGGNREGGYVYHWYMNPSLLILEYKCIPRPGTFHSV